MAEERPGSDLRAAAHGQRRAGGRLGDRQRGRVIHHRGRTPCPRAGLRAVAEVPAGSRLRGGAHDGWPAPVRRAGAAAAGREAGVHARRSRLERHRCRGRLLRREGADGGRLGGAGGAHRRSADARLVLVRRGHRVGCARVRRDTGAGTGQPEGEDRRDDAAARRRLRARGQSASGRLAHAAAGLRGRPFRERVAWTWRHAEPGQPERAIMRGPDRICAAFRSLLPAAPPRPTSAGHLSGRRSTAG
jgi:hypothetical protein